MDELLAKLIFLGVNLYIAWLVIMLIATRGSSSSGGGKKSSNSFAEGMADAILGTERRSYDSDYTAGYNTWSDD